jgi:hypothetical protein
LAKEVCRETLQGTRDCHLSLAAHRTVSKPTTAPSGLDAQDAQDAQDAHDVLDVHDAHDDPTAPMDDAAAMSAMMDGAQASSDGDGDSALHHAGVDSSP